MRHVRPRSLARFGARAALAAAVVVFAPAARAFVPPNARRLETRGELVFVPGATFRFGLEASWGGASPGTSTFADPAGYEVTVRAFYLDRTEVTVAAYGACVASGACPALVEGDSYAANHTVLCTWGKPGLDQHPVNCVSHEEAAKYCAFAGKRLPKEYEWELAERGPTSRPFPWGVEPPTPAHVNACGPSCVRDGMAQLGESFTSLWPDTDDDGFSFTSPVGSYPAGASPYGALDMAGNVEEWVGDGYWDPGGAPPQPGPSADYVVRGGSWDLSGIDRCSGARRTSAGEQTRASWLGFRCARDA
ncbi:MAG: hypothetical protein NVS3B10_25070 [Polyangiales bacterium]